MTDDEIIEIAAGYSEQDNSSTVSFYPSNLLKFARAIEAARATAEQSEPVAMFQFDERWKTWAQVDPNYAQDPDVIPLYRHPAEAMVVLQKLADAADIHLKGGVSSLRHAIDEARALCSTSKSQQDAAIESKQAEQSNDRWISVDERLPEEGTSVLASHGYGVVDVMYQTFNDHGKACWRDCYGDSASGPMHWYPLPPPPVAAAIESQRSGDGS